MDLDYYDVRLLNSILQSQDTAGTLGDCKDWMDGEYCRVCTLLQKLDTLERELKNAESEVLLSDDSV